MVPICRDTGSVIAFGGRAMDARSGPEVSEFARDADLLEGPDAVRPEPDEGGDSEARVTPCWSRATSISRRCFSPGGAGGRLVRHRADAAAGAAAAAVHVEGRAQLRSRMPPARGRPPGRASCWSPKGSRSTSWCWTRARIPTRSSGGKGGDGYRERLRRRGRIWNTCSIRRRPGVDFGRTRAARQFLGKMLAVAARIPDAAARDQFADRIAHKARITEEVVRAEIRKAAVEPPDRR